MADTVNQIDVRSKALDIACTINRNERPAKIVIAEAGEIEKYLWGKFAPQERAPTPLSTMTEVAEAGKKIINELLESCTEDPLRSAKLRNALMVWERFIAEAEQAIPV